MYYKIKIILILYNNGVKIINLTHTLIKYILNIQVTVKFILFKTMYH